jgi:hypothetical protein
MTEVLKFLMRNRSATASETLSGNSCKFEFYCKITGAHRVPASHRYQSAKELNVYTMLIISTEVSDHNVNTG